MPCGGDGRGSCSEDVVVGRRSSSCTLARRLTCAGCTVGATPDPEDAGCLRVSRSPRAPPHRGAPAPRARPARSSNCSTQTAPPGRGRGATRGTCRPDGASIRPASPTWSSLPSRPADFWRLARRLGRTVTLPARAMPLVGCSRSCGSTRRGTPATTRAAREHPQRQPAWRVAGECRRPSGLRTRPSRVERTLDAQRPDGSWPYGEGRGPRLDRLVPLRLRADLPGSAAQPDPRIGEAVERGAAYYRRFFDTSGRALLWPHKAFPEDSHSAGTGHQCSGPPATMTTAADPNSSNGSPCASSIRVLRDGQRRTPPVPLRTRRTVRYVRWCDAYVALGLVDAAAALRGVDNSPGRRTADRARLLLAGG